MTTPHEKAAEALRLADVIYSRPRLGDEEKAPAASMLREYAALLQAQAKVEPLTDEAIHDEFHQRMSADAEDMAMDVTDFRLGARFAEQHHGILLKGEEDDIR